MKQLYLEYEDLTSRVWEDHQENKERTNGHDFLHAFMVAQYAQVIAEDDRIGELTWLAGILHNTDRLYRHENATAEEGMIKRHLDTATKLDEADKQLIVEAVLNHSKPNDPDDNPVTVTLKDADRVANLGPNHLIRASQFRYQLPAVDPVWFGNDPTASFKNMKTAYRDIVETLVWEGWLRLPKAKELAKPYIAFKKEFTRLLEAQYEEAGLKPYPLEKW